MEPLTVDVWADIACPWCYIGKRKFEQGLERWRADGNDRDVAVTYHSYELSPDTPVDFEGSEIDFLAAYKGLPADRVQQMLAQVTAVAADVGLDYDFAALRHTRTLKAHQVLHLAKAHGLQLDLAERLYRAYFVEGRHVGHDDELADLAAEVGLDRDEVLTALDEGTYADAVAADIEQAAGYGIQGVPFFVLDGRYAVSGAQDPSVFVRALETAAGSVTSSAPTG